MKSELDVRGLSCPQPVFEVRKQMISMKSGEIEVRVDSATARDNIARLAGHEGWNMSVQSCGDEFVLTLSK
jgi:TusA-related sulfurtransferase